MNFIKLRSASRALLLFALTACSQGNDQAVLVGTLERDRLELAATAAEPISEVLVAEGQHIKAGDVVLQQDSARMGAQLAMAEAQVAEASAELAELVRGPRSEEVLAARARLDSEAVSAARESKEYDRVVDLANRKLISASAVDTQRAARDRAAAVQRESRARLAELLKGTRIEQLDAARAHLATAEAQRDEIAIAHARLQLRAPVDAIVESLPYRVGEQPEVGTPIAILLQDGLPFARVYVPEARRAATKVGSEAQVSVDGIDNTFAGRFRYVASEAAFTPYYALTQKDRSRLAFLAEVTLTDPAATQLPSGVPVEVWVDEGDGR